MRPAAAATLAAAGRHLPLVAAACTLLVAGCQSSGGARPDTGGGGQRQAVVMRDGPAPRHERDRPPPPGAVPRDIAHTPDAVPRHEPRSRYGNPASYVVFGRTYHTLASAEGYRERGIASWYGEKFHGRRTSSGEPYDMYAMTAAHKTLPLPTYVRVTHLGNGRSIVVRVNDRGPFHDKRIIDLSYAAAMRLGMVEQGQAEVEVVALTSPGPAQPATHSVQAPTPPPPPPAQAMAVLDDHRYLDAGLFSDPVSAVSMRESVVALGVQSVEIRVVDPGDGPRHQVLVGPFSDGEARARTLDYLNANRIPVRLPTP